MTPVIELTPLQQARRRYEEKNKEARKADRHSCKLDRHKKPSRVRFKEVHPLEVVFIDGEGNKQPDETVFTNANGSETIGKEDRYWVLQASTGDTLRCPRGEALSTEAVLDFLFTLQRPRRYLVCYGMGYDLTHWLRDLPDTAYRDCRGEEGIRWQTSQWSYKIRRFGLKILSITRWPRFGSPQKGKRITIADCMSSFGGSFVSALKAWNVGTPSELADLDRMKGLRGDFSAVDEEAILRYNEAECRLGAALMAAYVEAVKEAVGVEPTAFHGAGALAGLMLKHRGVGALVKAHREQIPAGAIPQIDRAFFGGQFQSFQIGPIGPVSNADLCAAYPTGIARLPAPGGSWSHQRRYQAGAPHGIWRVAWDTRKTYEPFVPFPWRERNGGIHYPPVGRGWYHACEVDAAVRIWGDRIQVKEGWLYTPPDDNSYPFWDWMHSDFAKRLAWGKTGKGLVIKLGDNSCYGKFAEKPIGNKLPPYKLPFWAGEITARTRAAIKDFVAPIWDRVVGIQCDAVLFTGDPPPVRYAKELGEMEEPKYYDDCLMVQPGLGFLRSGEQVTIKARGVAEKALDMQTVREQWNEQTYLGCIVLPGRERFVSRDLAIHQGREERAYHWITEAKTIRLRPGRGDERLVEAIPGSDALLWRSYHAGWNYDQLSAPYKPTLSEVAELNHLRLASLLEVD